jgi:glycosylphosphatidylinositol transamidase
MGLLTNEQSRNRVISFLVKHNQKLSVLVYIAGLSWFLALAYQPLNAGTYISENALLPGLVETELPSVLISAVKYKEDVEREAKKDSKTTLQNWVYEKFQNLGLETFQQNFSIIYPFRSLSTKVMSGVNVYSILRARRSASTEAVVFSVPLRAAAIKVKPATGGGIALALALAEEFKQKPYWSKDIIFLFSDYDEIGAMAWLDAYHETESQYIVTKGLEGKSGQIQAAINLELPLENVQYYNIMLEGLNGQLPNLDLVNLVVRLCRRERAKVAIHNSFDKRTDFNGESFEDYKSNLKTMLKMMWYQASGAPSGNHGLFHKFHIESITLQGVGKKKGSIDITTTARIVEGVFRSLNNLLERFHQSFFFYLLPSTSRYVSIGMYMPPFGLMALAGLIKGIALWITSDAQATGDKTEEAKKTEKKELDESEDETATEDEKKKESKEKEPEMSANDGDSADAKNILDDDDLKEPPASTGFVTIIPVILVSVLMGWMAHRGPELLTQIMPKFRIQTEDMIIYSMLAIFTAALAYPKLMTRKSGTPNTFVVDWRLLKSIALIGQTLALTSISLLNISQAFFLTAFMVPVTALVRPSQNRFFCWIQMLALVFVSPLSLMYLVGVLSAWPQLSTFDLLVQGYSNCKELIFLGVMDSYLFNAWTEAIITAVIFPIWLLFWAIPWVDGSRSST